MFDLNQIIYDYTVEVMNRFKGLDMLGRLPQEIWIEVHKIVQEDQNHPKENEMQEDKVVVWGGLTNSWE